MNIPRFWRKINNRYNLMGTKCENCGQTYFPPRNICPNCRREGEIVEHSFEDEIGELITYTIIRSAAEDHEKETPYILGIIELEENTRLTSQIVNCEIEDVEIGMKLKPVFRKLGEQSKDGLLFYGVKFSPIGKEE
ncbi:transcriptional regulator [archaeon SCG-AAA382B04]|nr:transcriptional regulator [archaeon SCG-AAA382B04]